MKEYLGSCGVRRARTALYNPRANGIVERGNRMIKGGSQLAKVNNLDVERVISELVWAYRTTEHVCTGKIPFEVMRGRKPISRMKPSWMQKLVMGCDVFYGNSTDKSVCGDKTERKDVRIKPGDWVKVKSGRVKRGVSKFLGPFRVQEAHKWHVVPSNGQRWNLMRVAKFASVWDEAKIGECDGCSGYMLMRDDEVKQARIREQLQDGGSGDGTSIPGVDAMNANPSFESARSVIAMSTGLRRPPAFLKILGVITTLADFSQDRRGTAVRKTASGGGLPLGVL
ncbi:hypothetical protein NDU88_005188 [Pleurodeles waltl]|uniref:Integrase catalytic domain-containing protein n=1 Tax=Pleurodeles waltl TaxID=8319 RepID=A0AAV7TU44_PLEWA|nr:hypothetical protein NDU88_005188 [Pleurodeles waltl]